MAQQLVLIDHLLDDLVGVVRRAAPPSRVEASRFPWGSVSSAQAMAGWAASELTMARAARSLMDHMGSCRAMAFSRATSATAADRRSRSASNCRQATAPATTMAISAEADTTIARKRVVIRSIRHSATELFSLVLPVGTSER
ncbi:MAG: hypothetical protein NVV74_25810 [Magnetospirillum sp.]|nr:hypothetical protein [Magnetospirillum sp.]